MFGLPGDTPKTMRSTIEFAKRISPDLANFTITLPFPGTKLYNEIQAEGRFLIRTDRGVNLGFYGNKAFFEIGPTKAEDVQRFHKKAFLEFYGRPSQILRILKSIRSFNKLLWIIDVSIALAGSIFKRKP